MLIKGLSKLGKDWLWKLESRSKWFVRVSQISSLLIPNARGACNYYIYLCTCTFTMLWGNCGNCRMCTSFKCMEMALEVVGWLEHATVGSRLSAPQLSVSGHLDVSSHCHVFGPSGKNTLRSLEFCYRRKQSCCTNGFPERYNAFSIQYEAANAVVHCIAAWQIKRRGK